jgi:hypothetical protein
MANYSGNNTVIGLVLFPSNGNPFWQVSFCLNDNDWFTLGYKFEYNNQNPNTCTTLCIEAENKAEELAKNLQKKIDDIVSDSETLCTIADMLNVECVEKDIVSAIQSLIDAVKL